MRKSDFIALDKMIDFIKTDLRHCIGVDANWVVALALSAYTETFGHLLPKMQSTTPGHKVPNYQCYDEFLKEWMNYRNLISGQHRPGELYDKIRNGLAHQYLLKTDAEVNMGTGSCGIEIVAKRQREVIRFNIVTYYDDFSEAVKKYSKAIRRDSKLQRAYDARMHEMKSRQRLA